MKRAIILLCVVVSITNGCATRTGKLMVVGGVAGCSVGHNNGGHTVKGGLVGVVIGGLIGLAMDGWDLIHVSETSYTGETVTVNKRVIIQEEVPVVEEHHTRKFYIDPNTGRKTYIN